MYLNIPTQPRILVVDDEPLLRLFNVDLLSDAGFEVFEAANAHEALRVLETTVGIRAVFTDVEMPGDINGFELAEQIEATWPEIGVLVTSGSRLPDAKAGAKAKRFVPKPYQGSHVIALMQSFVESRH